MVVLSGVGKVVVFVLLSVLFDVMVVVVVVFGSLVELLYGGSVNVGSVELVVLFIVGGKGVVELIVGTIDCVVGKRKTETGVNEQPVSLITAMLQASLQAMLLIVLVLGPLHRICVLD